MKGVEMRLLRFACVALLGGLMIPTKALAEKRSYDMTIEDTKINLVDNQDFHTFAFNGQVPAPLFHVMEGDEVTVNVTNLTSLPPTIHWHGLLQKGTWKNEGVDRKTDGKGKSRAVLVDLGGRRISKKKKK